MVSIPRKMERNESRNRNQHYLEKSLALKTKVEERKVDAQRTARERRLRDLQRIQSLHSGNDGGIDPLEIFPEEVWDIILSFLRESGDLENARKSCKLLENLLEKRRLMDILFPEVLKIPEFRRSLWDRPNEALEIPELGPGELTEDLVLRNETKMDWNLHLQLRLLSKSLRDTIDLQMDHWIEEESSYQFEIDGFRYLQRKLLGLGFTPRTRRGVFINHQFHSIKEFDPVLTSFPVERFVGKILKLYFVGRMDYQKYMTDTTSFLNVVGDQILYLQPHIRMFHFGDNARPPGVSTIEAYRYLQEWASRTPNLKHLNLVLETPAKEIKLRQLKSVIKKNPFPYLPKLERFTFRILFSGSNYEPEVFASIIDANQHLKEVAIEYEFFSPENLNRVLPSVRVLDLESFSFSTYFRTDLEDILNPKWPLRRIHLQMMSIGLDDDFHINVSSVFKYLHHFRDTLTHVALDLALSPWWVPEELDLPNLTHFSIRIKVHDKKERISEQMRIFNSIDYLIPMKKLEEIKWTCYYGVRQRHFCRSPEYELIKFDGGRYDLHEEGSNIWEVFPYLRTATVQVHTIRQVYKRGLRR